MKDRFLKNKKKIIVAILMIGSLLFPPVRALIPFSDLIPDDNQQSESLVRE